MFVAGVDEEVCDRGTYVATKQHQVAQKKNFFNARVRAWLT